MKATNNSNASNLQFPAADGGGASTTKANIRKSFKTKRSKSIPQNQQNAAGSDPNADAAHKYINFKIKIKDSGPGISDENIGKLFVNFSKLEDHQGVN